MDAMPSFADRRKPPKRERDVDPRPATELGRRLREIRARYIKRGGRLLTADEIDREVADRRGEQSRET